MRTNKWETAEGSVAPLGVSRVEAERAYNFALYSRHATHVSLLLYGADDLINPALRLDFDPLKNKSGRVWHCRVPDDQRANARYYAYSVDGESGPMDRFDPAKVLLDPYAKAVFFPPGFLLWKDRTALCPRSRPKRGSRPWRRRTVRKP